MTIDQEYPTPLPSTKGWGPGWDPHNESCSVTRANLVPHTIFQGGVRAEVVDLVDLVVTECQRRGYRFRDGWSWGFGCRATKGGSGAVPSFHSWGLGFDVNAPENPFNSSSGPGVSDIATNNRWVVGVWESYGFFWLGPAIGDWMHFSFAGSPADARVMTTKARDELITKEDDEVNVDKYIRGQEDFRQRARDKGSDPGPPPAEWDTYRKAGWNSERHGYNNPKAQA